MRLIDADANIETMKKCAENPENELALLCYRYAQRILEEAPTVPAAPRWHRAEEPPKQYGAFAVACVYDGKLYWCKGIYLDGKWLREGDGIEIPADYWMPLPEPPKEDAR